MAGMGAVVTPSIVGPPWPKNRVGYAGGVNETEKRDALALLRRLIDIDSTNVS